MADFKYRVNAHRGEAAVPATRKAVSFPAENSAVVRYPGRGRTFSASNCGNSDASFFVQAFMRFCLDDFGPFIFASTQPNEQIDYSRFFFFSWVLFCHWFFGQPVLGSAPGRASRAASRTRPPSTKTPATPKSFGYETDSNSGQTNASSDAYLGCDSDSRRDTCTFRN